MGMEAILNMLSSSGSTPSPNLPLDPSGPTLNELTLNPDVVGMPPQVPYAYGQGPNLLRTEPIPPMAPTQGAPLEPGAGGAEGAGWADKIKQLADVLKNFGGLQKSMEKNPLAAKMFQEHQQRTLANNAINENKIREFKKRDLASQILAQYGLL